MTQDRTMLYIATWDYRKDEDQPITERGLDLRDHYYDPTDDDTSNYIQFGSNYPDGTYTEVRISFQDVAILMDKIREIKKT